ncbi:MAG: S1 RNA-binding domain-containing protein [Phycisphaerae bacterium]|nr:S1 RNA-binding domain-containing protein [Phycisphaerae bacterium]NIX27109.1 S1 RNA-binding domain-containing protein [Phycisphaerae bacterium]
MSEETATTPEELIEESSSEEMFATSPSETETTSSDTKVSQTKSSKKSVKTRPVIKVSLSRGQELKGVVKTITDFGAFIDINLPQDGLVHISELSRGRVDKVSDVISVGDEVTVWVKNLDKERNRISLTMRKPVEHTYDDIQVDDVLEGEVTRIEKYGVFVDIGLEREGLVHVSELSHEFVKTPEEVVSVGDTVKVKVIKVNKRKKQVNLSIKALLEPPELEEELQEEEEEIFEDTAPMSTTMAAAFSAFSSTSRKSSTSKKSSSKSRKKRTPMDDVIARTLRSHQQTQN